MTTGTSLQKAFIRARFFQGASIAALMAATQMAAMAPAAAQQQAQGQQAQVAVEEIVVTGSRVVRTGFESPTPVTSFSADDLTAASPGTMAQALLSLPSIQGSSLPETTGIGTTNAAGASNLNLRALGSQRTLTLLDGRRFVPVTAAGSPDVSLFPSELLSRIEVVTGGASAAYGSDAVSGVINFILDKNFEGIKGTVEGGMSRYSDVKNYKISAAFGTAFANDRGHLVASGEYYDNDGLQGYGDRKWAAERWAVITQPAALQPPRLVNARNVGFSISNYGGLVTGAAALKGITFGPGGTLLQFNYGTLTGSTTQSGGDAVETSDTNDITAALRRKNIFTHAGYDVTDNVTAFVEAMWGEAEINYNGSDSQDTQTRAFTIFNDNAFLPAAMLARMQAANLTQFTLGRINRDWGLITIKNRSRTYRLVGGFDGKFGDGWTYGGYFTHGQNKRYLNTANNQIVENAYRAVDAVRNPAGQIVCRSTLTNPNDGCKPMNVFGEGSPSKESIDYVTGDSIANQTIKQDVAAFNVAGEPLSTWAGPVSIAFGAEYRKESTVQTVDPISASIKSCATIPRGCPTAIANTPGGFQTTNPQAVAGSFYVKEAYLETVVPLAENEAWADSLEVNGAVRYADYQLSGGVAPWKVGFTYQPIGQIRLRGTHSRDIRAANLNELFQPAAQSQPVILDPFNNRASTGTFAYTSGNPALNPEKSNTNTAGVVVQPSFFEGFQASVDYFDITIDGAINSVPAQDIADGCFGGNQALCAQIGFTATHTISAFFIKQANTDQLKTNGWDIEADYTNGDVFGGSLTLHGLATYVGLLQTKLGNGTVTRSDGASGRPHWRGTLRESYTYGPFNVFLQERYIGKNVLSNTNVVGTDISAKDNTVPVKIYTDLTLRYSFGEDKSGFDIYGTVNNLFDVEPPNNTHTLGTSGIGLSTSDYDNHGMSFKIGARFRY